jgi:hypothetical protein
MNLHGMITRAVSDYNRKRLENRSDWRLKVSTERSPDGSAVGLYITKFRIDRPDDESTIIARWSHMTVPKNPPAPVSEWDLLFDQAVRDVLINGVHNIFQSQPPTT